MSDKKIRIKVSELRSLIREAMGNDGSTIASRQTMIQAGDEEEPKEKEPLLDGDVGEFDTKNWVKDPAELDEVAPEGWEGTVKAMKKHKEVENPWALANWMKDQGYHSHKEESVARSNETLEEFKSFDDDFAEKIHDKQYEAMAKQIFDAWNSRDMDVNWAGVVDIFARNHSKNLGQKVDKTKLYEKVLDIVEKAHEPMYTVEDEAWK